MYGNYSVIAATILEEAGGGFTSIHCRRANPTFPAAGTVIEPLRMNTDNLVIET